MRDLNIANRDINIENKEESNHSFLWWILGIVGTIIAAVVGAWLLGVLNL